MALFVEMKANDVRPVELTLSAIARLTNSIVVHRKSLKVNNLDCFQFYAVGLTWLLSRDANRSSSKLGNAAEVVRRAKPERGFAHVRRNFHCKSTNCIAIFCKIPTLYLQFFTCEGMDQ